MNFRKLSTLKAFLAKQNKKYQNDTFEPPSDWVYGEVYKNSDSCNTGMMTTPEGVQWQFDAIVDKDAPYRKIFYIVFTKFFTVPCKNIAGYSAKKEELDICVKSLLLDLDGKPYTPPKDEKPVYCLSPSVYQRAEIEGVEGEFWQKNQALFARKIAGSEKIGWIHGPVYREVATEEESETSITFFRVEDFSPRPRYFVVHDKNDRCNDFTAKPDGK